MNEIVYHLVEFGGVATEQVVEAVPYGHAGELLRGDVGGAKDGEWAGAESGVGEEEVVGEDEGEGGVSDELEALVGGMVGVGGVGEGLRQKRRVPELVTQQGLHLRNCGHHRILGRGLHPLLRF